MEAAPRLARLDMHPARLAMSIASAAFRPLLHGKRRAVIVEPETLQLGAFMPVATIRVFAYAPMIGMDTAPAIPRTRPPDDGANVHSG